MQIRPARADDREAIGRLWDKTFPGPSFARPDLAALPSSTRVWLAHLDGAAVAAAVVSDLVDQPGARRLQVLAADDRSWTEMHDAVLVELQAEGVGDCFVVVREDSPFVLQQLEAAAYHLWSESWGAALDVQGDHDLGRLRQHVQRYTDDRVVVTELDVAHAEAAHGLYVRNRDDFPSTPATEADRYTTAEFTALISDARAFAAQQEGRLLALTVVRRHGATEAATDFTVVDRASRRRGLATAVKAQSVIALAEEGVRRFTTGGAAVNEGSLRANRRLGYVLEPRWLTYHREIGR